MVWYLNMFQNNSPLCDTSLLFRYFVNMFIDTTVGLFILYVLINLTRYLLRDGVYNWLKSGEYGNPPQVLF